MCHDEAVNIVAFIWWQLHKVLIQLTELTEQCPLRIMVTL